MRLLCTQLPGKKNELKAFAASDPFESYAPSLGSRTMIGMVKGSIREDDMTSPAETALTLVVVKSVAIVGSALTAVFLLALFGATRR